ncbi:MAG: molybdopterin molybdotransferase MoeA, partial [Candidatus Bathyarchaeota archaeon]|nr:molybdopterin molybdotransferase MoeA [Candidatus Bathyarchaeota archaeon]
VEAAEFQPKTLRLVEKEVVEDGEAKEIWTGNILPKGAYAVVMLEHTKKMDGGIGVLVSLTPGANVSKKGEDVEKGEVVIAAGVKLTPYHLGLLVALGMEKIEVVRKPKAAILATGNELVALGDKLEPNQIVEVNSIILSGMCAELGVEAFSLGIAKDDENEIREKISEGLAKADMVITTGGTSVGVHDLVPKIIEQMKRHGVVVHGIAMRPSMPTALAVVHRKPVIILSGNPVAAVIGFEVFARALIQKLLGTRNGARVKLKAKLTRRVAGVLGRRVFLRVKVVEKDGEFLAGPIRVKGSGIITTMTKANGYVIIPEDREGLRKNEVIIVHLFDNVTGEKRENV